MADNLRPIERRVLAMQASGLDTSEIGHRINRSPEHVERVLDWATIPRSNPPSSRNPSAIGQRILEMRAAGESHDEIARRFKRSPRSVRQIEGLAHFRLALDLLGREEMS